MRVALTISSEAMLSCQRSHFEMPRDVCFMNAASYSPLPVRTQQGVVPPSGARAHHGRSTPHLPTASTNARGRRLRV
jgi:hypothetical protein